MQLMGKSTADRRLASYCTKSFKVRFDLARWPLERTQPLELLMRIGVAVEEGLGCWSRETLSVLLSSPARAQLKRSPRESSRVLPHRAVHERGRSES